MPWMPDEHYVPGLKAQIEILRKALLQYVHCKHGVPDCNCTKDAREAMEIFK